MPLRLSKKQLAALSAHLREAYVKGMVRQVRARYQEQVLRQTDDQIEDTIRRAIDTAAGYNITGEYYLTRFIDYVYILGPAFATANQWARETLEDSSSTEEEKVERIDAHIYFVEGRVQ